MGIETVYTCDLCGDSWKAGDRPLDKLKRVSVEVNQQRNSYGVGTRNDNHRTVEGHWCSPCLVKSGLIAEGHAPEVKPDDPAPTLEDLVRDIVHQETEG